MRSDAIADTEQPTRGHDRRTGTAGDEDFGPKDIVVLLDEVERDLTDISA